MTRDDPTDTGGLFIGRRPGTAPVRLPAVAPSGGVGRRADATLATGLLALEALLCLSLMGPQPALWLWVGSQVEYLTGRVTVGIATIMLGCLVSLLVTMVLAKRVDHAWKLVRRAAGHRQHRGALERMFAACAALAALVLLVWMLLLAGPAPQLTPRA